MQCIDAIRRLSESVGFLRRMEFIEGTTVIGIASASKGAP